MIRDASRSTCLSRLCLLLGVLVMLGVAPGARADTGDYSVRVTATTGYPGWWNPNAGSSPFRTGNMFVESGQGSFSTDSSRRWRLEAMGNLTIMGGRIVGRAETPNAAFLVQLRQGSDGHAVRTVGATRETTTFDRALYAWHDWVDFGLVATEATKTSSSGGNRVQLTSLTLNLRDPAEPRVTLGALPDPDTWLGAACQPFAWTAADPDSGVWTTRLRNASTTSEVDSWEATARVGLQPGQATREASVCLQGDMRRHGVNDYELTVADRGGWTTTRSARLRFDLQAPVVSELGEAASYDEPRPKIRFDVTDAGSGLASVAARIDGAPVPLAVDEGGRFAQPENPLSVGTHELRIETTDQVGNVSTKVTSLRIGDVTAPALTLSSPAASGDAEPWLVVMARDAGSSVDAWSWQITVNGKVVPAMGGETGIATSLGPLAAGQHQIVVAVSDMHGNRATLVHRYTVEAAPGEPQLGGRTGLFVTERPRRTITYGRRANFAVTVLDHGAPVTGHRVSVLAPGGARASDVTDAAGRAELSVAVLRGSAHQAPAWHRRRAGSRRRPRSASGPQTRLPRRGYP
jgi:hypothetical protein